ncbi:MAG: hypothetical protein IIV45_13670, partial [Lachnospiraceae bacterium]|nr:hypothetical protein [Lachnospiraceae bacterium]
IMGILLIAIYVVKNIYIIYMNNHMYKFSYRCQKELASRLLVSWNVTLLLLKRKRKLTKY